MGDDAVLTRPRRSDINKQFKAGPNIRRTRRLYDRISTSKDYKFGELTAFFYYYNEDQDDAWQGDISRDYPTHITEQIKQNVISVLSKVNPDPHAPDPQVSLTFEWYPNDPKGVTMTVDATGNAYTMKISGLRPPPG
jgi:hypothetical protein